VEGNTIDAVHRPEATGIHIEGGSAVVGGNKVIGARTGIRLVDTVATVIEPDIS
jgi:hypothetical protein